MQLNADGFFGATILIVDDTEANVLFLRRALESVGYKNLHSATNGQEAIAFCEQKAPDLVLLDLHMPGMDGYATLEVLRKRNDTFLPVLVFTADTTSEAKRRALQLGASDFLTKPGDLLEICLRVKNFLQMRQLFENEHRQKEILETRVFDRTRELQEAHVEILARLAMAADYRDDSTGEHGKRVSEMSARIAQAMNLDSETINLIRYGSLLHDIGKVGIPDAILLKRGSLLADEYDVMKRHAEIGGKLLANSRSRFLQVAHEIALSHHERWDGTGYPRGLKGEDIPLSGRIVAIADVFDALTSERVYRDALSIRDAVAEIARGTGSQFDPNLVGVFLRVMAPELGLASAA